MSPREVKRCGSAGGGGAALYMDPEQCRLAGTVLFGAIVIIDCSKSKTKCT